MQVGDFVDHSGCTMDASGVYCLSYAEIDAAAEALIRSIDPRLLEKPQQIPILDWLENGVFGNEFEYRNIVLPKARGLTSFNGKWIIVRDSETEKLEFIYIRPGTIVINETLDEQGKRYTGGHETVHFLEHGYYYVQRKESIAADNDIATMPGNADFWLEKQANYGAAAILMPRRTLEMVAREFVPKDQMLSSRCPDYSALVKKVATTFNVSLQAAGIRLRQCGYIDEY